MLKGVVCIQDFCTIYFEILSFLLRFFFILFIPIFLNFIIFTSTHSYFPNSDSTFQLFNIFCTIFKKKKGKKKKKSFEDLNRVCPVINTFSHKRINNSFLLSHVLSSIEFHNRSKN